MMCRDDKGQRQNAQFKGSSFSAEAKCTYIELSGPNSKLMSLHIKLNPRPRALAYASLSVQRSKNRVVQFLPDSSLNAVSSAGEKTRLATSGRSRLYSSFSVSTAASPDRVT